MVHALLVASLVMFALWVIGLTGALTGQTAWMMFMIACCLLVAWAVVVYSTGMLDHEDQRRDRFA